VTCLTALILFSVLSRRKLICSGLRFGLIFSISSCRNSIRFPAIMIVNFVMWDNIEFVELLNTQIRSKLIYFYYRRREFSRDSTCRFTRHPRPTRTLSLSCDRLMDVSSIACLWKPASCMTLSSCVTFARATCFLLHRVIFSTVSLSRRYRKQKIFNRKWNSRGKVIGSTFPLNL